MTSLSTNTKIAYSRARKILRVVFKIALRRRLASRAVLCSTISFTGFVGGYPHLTAACIRQSTQEPKSNGSSPSDNNAPKINFKLTSIDNGRSDDGTWWTRLYIVTSDGHPLYKQCFPFSTVGRANKQFQLYLRHATKILRRGPEVDEKGKNIGERVLASFPEDEKDKTNYRLFWRSDSLFCQIEGEYSEDILALESRLKEKSLLEIVKESEH